MEQLLASGDGRGRLWGGLTPIQKAPPKSLRATQGQGSREWSMSAFSSERKDGERDRAQSVEL